MKISRNDPRAQRVLAEANRILARRPRAGVERAIEKHVEKLEREVAAIGKQLDAIALKKAASKKRLQAEPAPYRTRG